MLLKIAQVTKAAMGGVVGELAAKLVAGEVPTQPAILGECLQIKVPSRVAKRAYLVTSQCHSEKQRMAVLVRLDNLWIMRVGLASLQEFYGDHGLIRHSPALHQAQRTYSSFGDHPVMDTRIGLVRP